MTDEDQIRVWKASLFLADKRHSIFKALKRAIEMIEAREKDIHSLLAGGECSPEALERYITSTPPRSPQHGG